MNDAAIVRIDQQTRLSAARASVSRREGATAAGFRIVAPPGAFELRVDIAADALTAHRQGGIFEIRGARLSADGQAIDAATVSADGQVGEDLLVEILSDPTVTSFVATGVRCGSTIRLLSLASPALALAA